MNKLETQSNNIEKEKLDIPQFILVINGPSASGKSTVKNYFADKYSNIFSASRDRIKWLISGYSSKEFQKETYAMNIALIEIALEYGLHIIVDQGIQTPDGNVEIENYLTEEFQRLSKKFNVKLTEVNIEASFETISERFQDRIEAKKRGAKIAMTDPIMMKERFENYQRRKNENEGNPTFMTDNRTPEDIAEEILGILSK
jgi:ribose 1,5-bisphosphokinase PhnN